MFRSFLFIHVQFPVEWCLCGCGCGCGITTTSPLPTRQTIIICLNTSVIILHPLSSIGICRESTPHGHHIISITSKETSIGNVQYIKPISLGDRFSTWKWGARLSSNSQGWTITFLVCNSWINHIAVFVLPLSNSFFFRRVYYTCQCCFFFFCCSRAPKIRVNMDLYYNKISITTERLGKMEQSKIAQNVPFLKCWQYLT